MYTSFPFVHLAFGVYLDMPSSILRLTEEWKFGWSSRMTLPFPRFKPHLACHLPSESCQEYFRGTNSKIHQQGLRRNSSWTGSKASVSMVDREEPALSFEMCWGLGDALRFAPERALELKRMPHWERRLDGSSIGERYHTVIPPRNPWRILRQRPNDSPKTKLPKSRIRGLR